MSEDQQKFSFDRFLQESLKPGEALFSSFAKNWKDFYGMNAWAKLFSPQGFGISGLNGMPAEMDFTWSSAKSGKRRKEMKEEDKKTFDSSNMAAQAEAVTRLMQVFQKQVAFMQKSMLENTGKMGESLGSYESWGKKGNFAKIWKNLYENEIRRLITMPQIGLTREYQERALAALDRFSLFQGEVMELMQLMAVPMEKSFVFLQRELEKKLAQDELPEEKDLYNTWVKKLEALYLDMLSSPRCSEALGKTIKAMGEFKFAKDATTEDIVKTLPVPTRSEMDELYKDLYALKRRVRELEKMSRK